MVSVFTVDDYTNGKQAEWLLNFANTHLCFFPSPLGGYRLSTGWYEINVYILHGGQLGNEAHNRYMSVSQNSYGMFQVQENISKEIEKTHFFTFPLLYLIN